METINAMATGAARAVWGEGSNSKEPISGTQGNVPRGEPFDAGNLSDAAQQQKLNEMTKNPPSSHPDNETPYEDASSSGHYRHDSSRADNDEQLDDTAKIPSHESLQTSTKDAGPTDASSSAEKTSQSADKQPMARDAAAASSQTRFRGGEKEMPPGQDTGPAEEPSSDTAAEDKPSGADDDATDPQTRVMGDGPKSLEVVAKENGGDAGNGGISSKKDAANSASETDELGSEQGDQESKGTGEQYVRTTGFAADGGDFDATKPGAGKEADRLMEEKGKGREGGDVPGKSSPGDSDKPSLGERIKNKLHKH